MVDKKITPPDTEKPSTQQMLNAAIAMSRKNEMLKHAREAYSASHPGRRKAWSFR